MFHTDESIRLFTYDMLWLQILHQHDTMLSTSPIGAQRFVICQISSSKIKGDCSSFSPFLSMIFILPIIHSYTHPLQDDPRNPTKLVSFVSLWFRSIGTLSWIPGFLLFQFSPEELQDWSWTKLGRMAGPKMEKLDTNIWVKNPKLLWSLRRGWLSWVSFYPWFPAVLVMQLWTNLRSRYDDFVVENWKNFRLLHLCGWLWKFAPRNFGTL